MSTVPTKPPLLKRKSFWVVVVVVLVLCLPVQMFVGWIIEKRELDAKLAVLQSAGMPTSASEVNDFYVVPDGVTDSTELWLDALAAVQSADLQARERELPIVGDGETPIPAPGEEWAQLETVRTFLSDFDSELQTIHRAANTGGQVRFPVDFSMGIYTPIPHTQESRRLARLLLLDAHVSAHAGDHDRTLKNVIAIFSLSDALRGEPTVISQLVRIALHAIGCIALEELLPYSEWSDAELASLQVAVSKANFKDGLRRAYQGERGMSLSNLRNYSPTAKLFWQPNALEALRSYEACLEGLEESWPEALKRQAEAQSRLEGLDTLDRIRLMGVLLLMPTMEQPILAGTRATARQRCTNAALAAQRFRLQYGELPAALEDIGAELLGSSSLPDALVDPFDEQPLRYRMGEATAVIYSIDENLKDDGGNCDDEESHRPPDVGFILVK